MTDRITAILLTILVAGLCLVALTVPIRGQTEDVTTPPASVEPAPAPGDVGPPTDLATADVPGPAAPAPTPDVSGIAQAAQNGHWLVALGGIVMALVAVARALLKPKTRTAKLLLAGTIAALTTLGMAWQSGAGLSWALVGTALAAAWMAGGAAEHAKDIIAARRPK